MLYNNYLREMDWWDKTSTGALDISFVPVQHWSARSLTDRSETLWGGWVIKTATEQLAWSASNKDLKVIFIAGNEPFTQGPVDYKTSCKGAIEKGIIVNTIHCGDEATGIRDMWQDGAKLADGIAAAANDVWPNAMALLDEPRQARGHRQTYIGMAQDGRFLRHAAPAHT